MPQARSRPACARGAPPTRVAVGFGSLWVAVSPPAGADLLLRYDLDDRERHRTPIPHGIVGLATGQDHVWVAETDVPNVLRIDPRSDAVEQWATLADAINDLSAGGGYLWATHERADSIARVNPVKRNARTTTSVGHRPLRTVAAGGRCMSPCNLDHVVAVVDPASMHKTGRSPIPCHPTRSRSRPTRAGCGSPAWPRTR